MKKENERLLHELQESKAIRRGFTSLVWNDFQVEVKTLIFTLDFLTMELYLNFGNMLSLVPSFLSWSIRCMSGFEKFL